MPLITFITTRISPQSSVCAGVVVAAGSQPVWSGVIGFYWIVTGLFASAHCWSLLRDLAAEVAHRSASLLADVCIGELIAYLVDLNFRLVELQAIIDHTTYMSVTNKLLNEKG